jgi:hypothetical protein
MYIPPKPQAALTCVTFHFQAMMMQAQIQCMPHDDHDVATLAMIAAFDPPTTHSKPSQTTHGMNHHKHLTHLHPFK